MAEALSLGQTVSGAAHDSGAEALLDAAKFSELRRQMLKFASMQLGDAHLAEDAVQEALVGALRNADSFDRRAAFKTWVFAILKNKIADILRQRQRVVQVDDAAPEASTSEGMNDFFDTHGMWNDHSRPSRWNAPHAAVEDQHFWRVFEACLDHLPGQQGRVFMMREFVELQSDEICSALQITPSNLKVMLHRARLRLRACLAKHWFEDGDRSC